MSGYLDTVTKANKEKDTTGKRYLDVVVMINLLVHLTTTGENEAFLHPETTDGTLRSIAERITGAFPKVCRNTEMRSYQ